VRHPHRRDCYRERVQLTDILKLEQLDEDTWQGSGPSYPWGGLFGGQIMAQGLMAAFQSVEEAFSAHSMHAYFIRRGDPNEPIQFEVDRIRDGRSFLTRRVVARQAGRAILNMSASFHEEGDGALRQTREMPAVPAPEGRRNRAWSEIFECRGAESRSTGRIRSWYRANLATAAEGDRVHFCALAFMSDDAPAEALLVAHPDQPANLRTLWMASLDHSIWFHRPPRADEYHLFDFECHSVSHGRGLSLGHVYDRHGGHVATVAQEVLSRPRK